MVEAIVQDSLSTSLRDDKLMAFVAGVVEESPSEADTGATVLEFLTSAGSVDEAAARTAVTNLYGELRAAGFGLGEPDERQETTTVLDKKVVMEEASPPIPCTTIGGDEESEPAAKGSGKAKGGRKRAARKGKRGRITDSPAASSNADEDLNAVVARVNEASAREINEFDDYTSAWEQSKAEGRVWGGRGAGGRGVNRGLGVNNGRDAVVNQVTLSFSGRDLLYESRLVIAQGHRYGLLGKNGVGKTTLLRRIASGSIPGWPMHLTTAHVQQEVLGTSASVFDCMREGHSDGVVVGGEGRSRRRGRLEEEQAELEAMLADEDVDADDKGAVAERLSDIYERLEALDLEEQANEEDHAAAGANANDAGSGSRAFFDLEARAMTILKGLKFKASMLALSVDDLSGGWRMRLALARALYSEPDILLLDEPTNHLDLSALMFLETYLVENDVTAVIVSHDGHFLDAVCTDMIKFEDGKLKYHVGNYSSFREMEEQAWARNCSTGDAAARKEKKAKEFILKQRSMSNSKHRDDNKQRQAAERQKKLGRIGLYSENGHKFKLLAVGKTGNGGSNRAAHIFGNYTATNGMQSHLVSNDTVAFGEARQLLNFKFPAAPPIKGGGTGSGELPLITMENCRFRYGTAAESAWLLQDISLGVSFGSRIAIVGENGAGKSSLVKLLCGELSVDGGGGGSGDGGSSGTFHSHPNLKVAHIAQHHIEHLGAFLEMTPVDYFMQQHQSKNPQEVRQFLGGFGLGPLALQLIGTLSGGQKARLAFATVMYTVPHVLILDEPTNHLDSDSLESLAAAIEIFQGAVVMVSHNQQFMACCAKEMWTVRDGRVKVQVADGEMSTFDNLFEGYRQGLRKKKGGPKPKAAHPGRPETHM